MKTVALHLGLTKETGGLFQYARTLASALARGCPEDRRVVCVSPEGTEWRPICRQLGLDWVEVKNMSVAERAATKTLRLTGPMTPWRRRLMSSLTPLGRTFSSLDVDLCVYTASEHYSFELQPPSIIPIHDLMHRYEPRFAENQAYADPDGLYRKICNGASGILVDSEIGREHLVDSYGPFGARVHILPFVAPDYVYDPSLLPADPLCETVLHALPRTFFFYPAQFWEHKNHVGLIDAVMRVAEHFPDVHLVLAGSPKNYYEAVVRHVHEVGATDRVTILGFVSDTTKMALYRRARALVLPLFHGPTSIPPLEAIQVGCAVAMSDVYGNRGQLDDAALYFDPASIDEMADVLETMWSDDAVHDRLVERGYERAAQWGQQQFSERLWQIVEETLAPPP